MCEIEIFCNFLLKKLNINIQHSLFPNMTLMYEHFQTIFGKHLKD